MKQREPKVEPRYLFPPSLSLRCQSRWPTMLSETARRTILETPLPSGPCAFAAGVPPTSVIVPTLEQEALTRLCLGSVLGAGRPNSFELIVVDNGSTEPAVSLLTELARSSPCVKLVSNPENRGFAAAANQGLALASGEMLVLLNNDTVVCDGWLEKLARRVIDRSVGMAGCLTNRSGGENEINTDYSTYGQLVEFAQRVARSDESDFEVEMLPLSCACLRRDVLNRVGALDEGYGLGLFEDDDLSLRLRRAGYRIVIAADCHIHHFGQASMGNASDYAALLSRNRDRFERKWGIQWRPREKRPSRQYWRMVERIRAACRGLAADAKVAVLSRGDEELLRLGDAHGAHFMQNAEGVYWGAHAADSDEAIARWRGLQERGFQYLLVPDTALWWLSYYDAFGEFVKTHFEPVVIEPATCRIFRLKDSGRVDGGGVA